MAQLPQGLGLDLADALTGDVELLAYLLQRAGAAILDAYSNQLITGMSTMEEQTNLSAALQELSAALSGL